MTSTVYQATVEELESLLSPRVVSRSLQEGLKLVGKSPQTVVYEDIEKILKAQVYRQLQVALPVTEAKTRIHDILEKVKNLEIEEAKRTFTDRVLNQQAEALISLKESLKPFNLFFEWSEVQKLRALIQLLETEQQAGREANKLIGDAREQLKLVEQKLEDALVHQAKELSELERTFEAVQTLGGAKVRRLESLMSQIRGSQETRQLATAELERARKLSLDLRKLMESSVIIEGLPDAAPPPRIHEDGLPAFAESAAASEEAGRIAAAGADDADGLLEVESEGDSLLSIDTASGFTDSDADLDTTDFNTAAFTPDVNAKLLELDVESERHDVAALERDYSALLGYHPELKEATGALFAALDARRSVVAEITEVRARFEAAQQKQRETLRAELSDMLAQVADMPDEIDSSELRLSVQVALGVLETSLPVAHDIKQIRSLQALAKTRLQELASQQAADAALANERLAQQQRALTGFAETLERYRDAPDFAAEYGMFAEAARRVEAAQAAGQFDSDALTVARETEVMLAAAIAERSEELAERQRALLQGLHSELQRLPELPAVAAERLELKTTLDMKLMTLETDSLGDAQLEALRAQLAAFKETVLSASREAISALKGQALDKGLDAYARTLDDAEAALADGVFPDTDALERALTQALEARWAEQGNDLQLLETELRNYQGARPDALVDINEFIAAARKQLESGDVVTDFERGWTLLELIRQDSERRTAGFIPRLDAALADLATIKLNSEEVAKVRRTLAHLDAQREAFERVSAGLQHELEAALVDAETQISALQEQFEATKAIAGQLVNASVLDDLFGAFDAGPLGSAVAPAKTPEPDVVVVKRTELPSTIAPLNTWLEQLRTEPGVRGAAIYRENTMLCAYLDMPADALGLILSQLDTQLASLGTDLGSGRQQVIVIELANHGFVCSWPSPDTQVVVITAQPAALDPVVHGLRRDVPQLREWLGASSYA